MFEHLEHPDPKQAEDAVRQAFARTVRCEVCGGSDPQCQCCQGTGTQTEVSCPIDWEGESHVEGRSERR